MVISVIPKITLDRKMKAISTIAMLFAVFAAQAEVSGTYRCQTRISQTVTASGKTKKVSSVGSGFITFFPDGTSESRNPVSPFITRGTWSQVGNKFYGEANIDDTARDVLYGCQSTGSVCTLVGVIGNSTGKVSKNENVLTGTSNIQLTMIVNGIFANSKAVSKFTCVR